MITAAGLDALVNAQGGGTDPIQIAELGITENNFVMAPTITSVPGELKRIGSVSGESTSETIIHMTAQDSSEDIYELRGLGLYLADGTLFAIYSQETPIFRKVSISFFLLALDISFENAVAGDIVFGDTSFLLPPASETVKGVAEIADAGEAAEGADDSRIMSPAKVKLVLDAIAAAIGSDGDLAAALAALVARTITGTGLVSGGGDLSESRTLDVEAASPVETAAGAVDDKAVTPTGLIGALAILGGWNSGIPIFRIPGTPIIVQTGQVRGTYTTELAIPVVLPVAFPTACIWVGPITYISADDSLRDIFVQMRERSASGFNVYYQAGDSSDNRIDGFDWIAIGY
ncbi:hypothetical protein [Sphingobium sp.]|uniref:gp53-like domain-containing protein n=1 Tax=Sphingobium sp. TaxID=1912891 RepID=UPI0028BD1EAD|nr:hypothetical protein [Sphingobium sp.]